jgi:NRPS condensation-like uncharacterized protein
MIIMVEKNSAMNATSFEWYMLEDHSTEHPMVFTFCFDLVGSIDVAMLQQAFLAALTSHPLLVSRAVALDRWPRYAWERRSVDHATHLRTGDVREHQPHAQEHCIIDPFQGPNCRLSLYRQNVETPSTGAEWTVAIDFHHAVADGIGALEFCSDVFRIYEELGSFQFGAPEPSVAPKSKRQRTRVDMDLLAQRDVLDRSIPHPVGRGTAIRFWIVELAKFLFAWPARISEIGLVSQSVRSISGKRNKNDPKESLKWSSFGLTGLEFPRECTKPLRDYAQRHGGTLNHVLLAAVLRAMAKRLGGAKGRLRSWVTVLPVNMRRATSCRAPCHNGIGYAFLRRSRLQCLDWQSNFLSLKTEIEAIQTWKLAGLFLDAMACIQRLPKWLARLVIRSSRPGSFVWSYVGEPLRRFPDRLRIDEQGIRLGNAKLLGLSVAPPTRPGTEMAIVVLLWQDCIKLWFRFDERRISPEQASQIRNLIAEEVASIVEEVQFSEVRPRVSSHR